VKQRSTRFNPKRRLLAPELVEARLGSLRQLSEQVRYGGNPEHKRNPGDFGLVPPAAPRAGKSLCDDAGVVTRREALGLLRAGRRRALSPIGLQAIGRTTSGW